MSRQSLTTPLTQGFTRRGFLAGAGGVGLVAATGFTLAGCGSDTASGNTLQKAQDAGKITVGFAGERPHSFKEDGKLTGAAIAIDSAAYKELGIDKVEGVLVDWGGLIPGLKAGRFDAVSADMSILPERCKEVAFSTPTFRYTTALMTPPGNPMGLMNLDDAAAKGANIAVMAGALESGYCDKLGINKTSVDTAQDGMDAVTSGRVDAFALTGVSLHYMKKQQPDAPVDVTPSFVQAIDGVPQISGGAATFRQGDTELVDAFNEKVRPIVTDKQRYLSLVSDFGFSEAEMPDPDWTTQAFCDGKLP
ncbi:transporter substrate-binding domain-containing protein [Tomitella fengzijianii]|uniref:Transporter substrate-binding domain-containing protein n=1 Tax=Tomitella fengzijianii TaxID=2597660 RepID=A0A516X1C0_9ACTN|nr:transporter substrate-binding domain-containing protein [Tomitella fengzijianii]QDQ96879.1 transporter substrate-binding domain-containing protein [Tomitella fengzijianii]